MPKAGLEPGSFDAKLAKIADAIEAVGISDTLAARLAKLERQRTETEGALRRVPPQVKFLPDVVPALVLRWRQLLMSIESFGENPVATHEDIETARANLRALRGTITLKPRDGIHWAHPAPNAKGLTEVRPLDGLRINSPLVGSGDRICLGAALVGAGHARDIRVVASTSSSKHQSPAWRAPRKQKRRPPEGDRRIFLVAGACFSLFRQHP